MAYSVDFRKRAIEFMEEGHTGKELYESFKIYPSEVNKWRKLLEKTGSLEPQYPKMQKRKIDHQKLKEALEKKPDAYLSELAKQFDCTKQAVFYALKKQKITRKKKTFTYSEKSYLKRYLYWLILIICLHFWCYRSGLCR